jgi:hypothetical protein
MELEGVVQNGAFVPDDTATMPEEGSRVRARFEPVPAEPPKAEPSVGRARGAARSTPSRRATARVGPRPDAFSRAVGNQTHPV